VRRLIFSVIALVGLVLAVGGANAASAATFTNNPAAGPPGSSITVASITPCPPNPVGVVGPRLVRVTLTRASLVFGSVQLSVNAAGSWKGSLALGRSATPGAARLDAFCFSSAQAEGATLAYDPRTFTVVGAAPPARPVSAVPAVTG
jgi:hypothetical protein